MNAPEQSHILPASFHVHCLALVSQGLVISRLDYCSALYMGLPLKTVQKNSAGSELAAR